MADSVTISSSVAVRSVRDEEHGIHEYLEEHHPVPESPERTLALPVRLSGWLWRREGFGFFRRYRRRFCVFKAEQSALFVFSDDDTVNGKVLRRLVLTKVALTSRTERSFVVQGYLADRELHKQASDSMASKVSSLKKGVLPGDQQRFYMPEEEKLKAVSQKACSVWTHCFKYHMRSYALRQPRDEAESESQEEVEEDPDFVFEDVRKSRRRHSMGSALRSGSTISSSMLSASRPRSRSKGKVGVVVRPRGQTESEKRESDQFGHDRACGSTSRLDKELTASVASEGGKDQEPEKEELLEEESSTLPCVSSIFEDEELLSHSIDFDTIVKKDMLASGALGEVWIAMHRSQEVVVKNLRDDATLSARLKGDDKTATRRRHQAFLDFVEEIRITSRLEHNRIVEFRGLAWSTGRDLLLVLEYLPRGDLRTYLSYVKRQEDSSLGSSKQSSGRNQFRSIWTWTKAQWRLAIDVIEGLVYLHSLNPPLIHGDLKSRNILLRNDLRAKLADFGLSRYLQCTEGDDDSKADCQGVSGSLEELVKSTEEEKIHGSNASSSQYSSRVCGTGRWMAPELLKSDAQSSMAADVYAFGIVLSEIDTCELPFAEREKLAARSPPPSRAASAGEASSENGNARSLMSENALVRKIVAEGWKPSFRVTCPDAIKMLAHDCLAPNPQARPSTLAVAHRLRKAASKRERPEALAAQARATTSPLFR